MKNKARSLIRSHKNNFFPFKIATKLFVSMKKSDLITVKYFDNNSLPKYCLKREKIKNRKLMLCCTSGRIFKSKPEIKLYRSCLLPFCWHEFVDIPWLLAAGRGLLSKTRTWKMEELAVEVCGKNGAYYKVILPLDLFVNCVFPCVSFSKSLSGLCEEYTSGSSQHCLWTWVSWKTNSRACWHLQTQK